MTGFEPATPRATVSCSNQLSYTHRKSMFILFLTPRPIRRRYFFEIPLGRTRSEFATPENIKRIHGAPGATRTPDTLLSFPHRISPAVNVAVWTMSSPSQVYSV